jgi:hypothetical protein
MLKLRSVTHHCSILSLPTLQSGSMTSSKVQHDDDEAASATHRTRQQFIPAALV